MTMTWRSPKNAQNEIWGKEESRRAMNRTASDHWLHMSSPGGGVLGPKSRNLSKLVVFGSSEERIFWR